MRASMARKTPSGLWITVGDLLSNESTFHKERALLAGLPGVNGEDEAHAAELDQLLYVASPDLPKIYF